MKTKNKGAKCMDCKQYMQEVETCTKDKMLVDGVEYPRNTTYHDINENCHDCGITNGKVHHFGCDMERCPKCEEQAICCDCKKDI